MLGGKSVIMAGVCLRGDLYRKSERPATEGEKDAQTAISVGRYVSLSFSAALVPLLLLPYPPITTIANTPVLPRPQHYSASIISTNCTLRPPMRISRGQMTFYPIRISDNVFIGPESHIAAASISSHVHIGAHCVLLPFCVIKEQCKILPGTVVPPHMVIPPGSVVAGRPARVVGEVGEGWGMQLGGGEGEEWVEGGDLRPLVRCIK
ncbi:hypothetical protein D0867_07113 [Hortaea werneckii]|uniref:Dynactin subunit 5 n=1 Tax=Hortaea werneckii TaxID=91943 RepID=A0A3M7AMR8_HORWE|nr:hypothetical protein D0867_07113 [Hortaea werneckii]RMY28803.1 hypothetical protein D0866_09153 [Hortaea werneckii]